MPDVQVAERAGGEVSEDRVIVLPNAVAVLDGATSLRPRTRTGGWYADQLGQRLRAALLDAPHGDLAELLADSIGAIAGKHGLRPGDCPSSTVSVLRWTRDRVDALVLADSPIVMFTTSGASPVTDDRLARLRAPSPDNYRERLRAGGGFDEEHLEALRAAVDATGQLRNTEGGFWVAEAVPEAAHRAVRASWPRDRVLAAMALTDGVSCGVAEYGLYPDWSSVLEHAGKSGPRAVLDTVRAAEESDPDGIRWPRPKRHDDQALALVRFGP